MHFPVALCALLNCGFIILVDRAFLYDFIAHTHTHTHGCFYGTLTALGTSNRVVV